MLIYCILCEEMTDRDEGLCHTCIEYQDAEIGLSNLGICCFPLGYAFCPPPENDLDSLLFEEWQEWIEINRPSDDEILISDLNAVELREEMEQA